MKKHPSNKQAKEKITQTNSFELRTDLPALVQPEPAAILLPDKYARSICDSPQPYVAAIAFINSLFPCIPVRVTVHVCQSAGPAFAQPEIGV
jgi:hypothetical protein